VDVLRRTITAARLSLLYALGLVSSIAGAVSTVVALLLGSKPWTLGSLALLVAGIVRLVVARQDFWQGRLVSP
jgi:hypothetical protein